MSSKYIASVGKEKQLLGPVLMNMPDCYRDEDCDCNCPEYRRYYEHLASLPIAFTNVSWLKESDNGKILELNVHFLSKECDKDRKCTNDNILSCHDKGCQKPIAVPIKDKEDGWIKIESDTEIPNSMIEALHEDGKTDTYRVINGVIYSFDHKTESPLTHYKIKYLYQDKQPERMFTLKDILGVIEFTKNLGYMNGTKIQSAFTPEDILTAFETTKTPQP